MVLSKEYQRLVVDDLKTYKDIARPVKSSILARLLIHQLPLTALHPNPEDEFCNPEIGPNDGFIAHYIDSYSMHIKRGEPPVQEKLMVEKMSTGGYMLINGHHRWMAAAKMKLRTVPVKVMNSISEEEILFKLNSSDKQMCVSFDLDEVLLTDSRGELADHPLPFPYGSIFKRTLRKNAGILIGELQRLGFDVWVYSGSGISVEEINRILSLHKAKVNGIINSNRGKQTNSNLKQAFRQKYKLSIHIDNESVLWVDTVSREYDSIAIAGGVNWADDAFVKVRSLDVLKQIAEAQAHA